MVKVKRLYPQRPWSRRYVDKRQQYLLDDPNRRATQEEFETILGPVLQAMKAGTITTHGEAHVQSHQ